MWVLTIGRSTFLLFCHALMSYMVAYGFPVHLAGYAIMKVSPKSYLNRITWVSDGALERREGSHSWSSAVAC